MNIHFKIETFHVSPFFMYMNIYSANRNKPGGAGLPDLPLGVDSDFLRIHPGGSFLGRSGGGLFRDHPEGWISFFCGTFTGRVIITVCGVYIYIYIYIYSCSTLCMDWLFTY